jgi:3-hydroxybutyryl-CoA dehydratase
VVLEQSHAAELPEVGTRVSFSKTLGESDIYLFAGISGDFSPNHVNAEYMKATRYGRIVAHGVLMLGFMSTCSTRLIEMGNRPAVSYGYDRVRFVRPVFVGDTVTVDYEVTQQDPGKERTTAQVTATNQRGEVVAVATHIIQYL